MLKHWLVTTCVGLVLGYFIHKKIAKESFFGNEEGFLVHWTGQMLIVVASYFLKSSSILLLLSLSLLCFLPVAWSEIRKQVFIKSFLVKRVHFLDFIVLHMKSGLSLREAVRKLTLSESKAMSKSLQVLYDRLHLYEINQIPSDFPAEIQNFFDEIEVIDKNPAKKLENILKLRAQYRILEGFKQKSAAAVAQARAQSFVVLVLYLAAIFYGLHLDPSFSSHQGFFLSILMFSAGLFWLFNLGRKVPWKV
jgi:Flp pilus assembly protein TadB